MTPPVVHFYDIKAPGQVVCGEPFSQASSGLDDVTCKACIAHAPPNIIREKLDAGDRSFGFPLHQPVINTDGMGFHAICGATKPRAAFAKQKNEVSCTECRALLGIEGRTDPFREKVVRSSPPVGLTRLTDYPKIGQEIGDLVTQKQVQYGDSFGQSHAILTILYPDGVEKSDYHNFLAVVRVIDKLFRIANKSKALKSGLSETESPWRDIAGYALLAIKQEQTQKPDKETT